MLLWLPETGWLGFMAAVQFLIDGRLSFRKALPPVFPTPEFIIQCCTYVAEKLSVNMQRSLIFVIPQEVESTCVRFEVFTEVTMKNGVFWDVTPGVALVRTDVSEELSPSISVTRIAELATTLAVTSNRRKLRISLGISWQGASVVS
jgi:hypothetical protein